MESQPLKGSHYFFSTQNGLSWHLILLIVDYHAATGGQDPRGGLSCSHWGPRPSWWTIMQPLGTKTPKVDFHAATGAKTPVAPLVYPLTVINVQRRISSCRRSTCQCCSKAAHSPASPLLQCGTSPVQRRSRHVAEACSLRPR